MDRDNVPLIHAGYLVKSPPKARSSRNFKRVSTSTLEQLC